MNSLVLSEINYKDFQKQENLFVIEQYYHDYLKQNDIKNEIHTLSPSFSKKSERILAMNECESIYQPLLKDLSESLNNLHQVNFSNLEWEIVFGNWLRYFIWICYERYHHLIYIIESKKINKIYCSKNNNFAFALNNTESIAFASINDDWNSNLYFKILEYRNLDCEKIIFDSKNQISEDGYSKSIKNKNFFVRFFQKFLSILSILKSNNDGVIVNSYLPLVYEKIFEIFLFQAPASWKFKKINYDMLDHNLRKKIILPLKKTKNLNNFIRENIKNFLPKSTVETFPKIIENAKNSNLPSNPKFIFTSNDFENNEIFKVYAAIKKSENKTTYIIGQHGNTYFTDLRSNKHRSELSFSDKFLSWGYEKKEKIHSAFNFLSLGKKKYKKQINNRLMLIISPLEFRMFPFNTIHQTEKGFSDSLDILNNLKNEISKNAIIRLHPSYHSKRGQYYVKKYFTKKNFSIDYGYESFVDARANSKISFFNYDSTGILENLALNYPTICMWDNFKNNLSDEFLSKYELLIKANILFLDKKDLVNHLNNIWQNIDKWWLSENTQKLIQEFNKDFNNRGNLFSLLKLRKKFFH